MAMICFRYQLSTGVCCDDLLQRGRIHWLKFQLCGLQCLHRLLLQLHFRRCRIFDSMWLGIDRRKRKVDDILFKLDSWNMFNDSCWKSILNLSD